MHAMSQVSITTLSACQQVVPNILCPLYGHRTITQLRRVGTCSLRAESTSYLQFHEISQQFYRNYFGPELVQSVETLLAKKVQKERRETDNLVASYSTQVSLVTFDGNL